jgi:photosystem II stability/assembly factor-like uncharacterized protein
MCYAPCYDGADMSRRDFTEGLTAGMPTGITAGRARAVCPVALGPRGLGACILLAALAAPTIAHAHGRFPQAGQVIVDPANDARIWVRTTYGIITTDDAGGLWSWVCPDGVGFDADKEDPPVGFMSDGTVIAGTFDGLSVSHDRCDFAFPAELKDRFVIDLVVEPSHVSAVALSSNGVSTDTFEVKLFDTSDNAASWTEIGTSPPSDFLALTLGVAPSDPQRVYVTGRDGMAGVYAGAMMRSDDRGQTWTRFSVPLTDTSAALPYMGAVDPNDADRVYLGVVEQDMGTVVAFALVVTEDGGSNWQTIFERSEAMSGFTLSPDGGTIAIGGAEAGLWMASADDYAFSKVNELHVRCLTWEPGALYACADQFIDGYNLGRSIDGGATFSELSQLSSPCGPPSCAADTTVGSECPARWPEERIELGAEDCDGGGGGGGGGSEPGGDGGGCGCSVPGTPQDAPRGAHILWALAALAWIERRWL